jgi:dolichol kinase
LEIASGSAFFQFSLYVAVRLGHRGFTLGELGLVVFGATALFTESVNLTVAKVRRLECARTEIERRLS